MIIKSAQKVDQFAHILILHHGGQSDEERVYGGTQLARVAVDCPFLASLFPLSLSWALNFFQVQRGGWDRACMLSLSLVISEGGVIGTLLLCCSGLLIML